MTDELKPCPDCVYATERNTPAVRKGFAVGGYLKTRCPKHEAEFRTPTPAVHEPLTQAEHLAEMQRLGQLYDAAPLTTNPELLAALEASAGYEMSEEEIRLQKESWVRGQCGPSTSTVVPAHAAPQGAPDLIGGVDKMVTPQADHIVNSNKMINADLIRELKHHAQEWSGRIVGDRLTEAANALATSDARIAALQAERDEDANQLDSARHTVDVLTARIATARNEALEKAAGYHDLRVEAAEEDLADCDDEPQMAAVQRVINKHKHYAKGIRALKTPEGDG